VVVKKIISLKQQLQQAKEAYDSTSQVIDEYRSKQEELARHVEGLVKIVDSERMSREKIESDLARATRDHELQIRQEQRSLEAKDTELRNALANFERTQSLLIQREKDLAAVQDALKDKEKESKLLGESQTTARFSLQLEVDKITRDLQRAQEDLLSARKAVEDKEKKIRDKEEIIDGLHAEKLELKSQLAAQTQAKLNVSEKLDSVRATLKGTESEISNARARIHELESRFAKDQRELLSSENQYRDQLTERNTLLLTIYQYMDKILGVDKTPVSEHAVPSLSAQSLTP
jgi:chromosome segregation ATPase